MGLFDYSHSGGFRVGESGDAQNYVFLENLSPADWKKILAHAETKRFAAGQVLIRNGDADDSFYILSEGTVEVILPEADEVFTTIAEGAVFGEMAFFDCLPRSATIRARTAGTAIRISRDGFTRLSGWEPALARSILLDLGKVLALRLRATNARFPG